jgi:hypothetical protein
MNIWKLRNFFYRIHVLSNLAELGGKLLDFLVNFRPGANGVEAGHAVAQNPNKSSGILAFSLAQNFVISTTQ